MRAKALSKKLLSGKYQGQNRLFMPSMNGTRHIVSTARSMDIRPEPVQPKGSKNGRTRKGTHSKSCLERGTEKETTGKGTEESPEPPMKIPMQPVQLQEVT